MKDPREMELILEEIFMNDDINEEYPCNVYITKDFTFIVQCPIRNIVRLFELTMSQGLINMYHREEILQYRLSKVTEEDELYLGDIFMHGKYIKPLNLELS